MQNTASRIDDVEAEVVALSARMNAAEYLLLSRIRELENIIALEDWTFPQWLAWRCNMSKQAACERVRVARALPSLPAISAAFADGRLSYSKVRILTRMASTATDAEYLKDALVMSVHQLEILVRRHRRISNADAEKHTRDRFLQIYEDDDGTWVLRGRMAPDDAAIVLKALNVADPCQSRIDCLVEVASAAVCHLASGDDARLHVVNDIDLPCAARGAHAGAPPSDSVFTANAPASTGVSTADASVSTTPSPVSTKDSPPTRLAAPITPYPSSAANEDCGDTCVNYACACGEHRYIAHSCDAEHCAIEGIPIAKTTADRLCCENPLNRHISTVQRRILMLRQGGTCFYPGCTHRRFLDGHHIVHWASGGRTVLGNLCLICSKHHRLLHEGRFTIDIDRTVRNRWGHVVVNSPEPPCIALNARDLISTAPTTTDTSGTDRWDGSHADWDDAVDGILNAENSGA